MIIPSRYRQQLKVFHAWLQKTLVRQKQTVRYPQGLIRPQRILMIGLSENVSQYVLFQLEKLSRAKFLLEKNIVSEEVRLLRTWSWVFLQFLCHCHLHRVLRSKDNYHCIKYQVKQRSLQGSWNFSGFDWIRTHVSRTLIGLNKQLG